MSPDVVRTQAGVAIGIDADTGALVLFEEARANPGRLARLKALTPKEQRAVAISRLETREEWPAIVILPGGVFDRYAALHELRSEGSVAETLIRVEMNVIEVLIEMIRREARNA